MPRKNSHITVTDQFCGAGGSSQGVRNYSNRMGGGVEVKLALNHWKLAIETHNTNFPDTLHDCTDVSAADPRRYPSTDILITSPECTTHTPAGGNHHKALKKQMDMFDKGTIDPATERSRATMWDVCRFTEYHKYNIIIVENVVEAKTRWPLFDVWLTAMHTLGYHHKCCYLNSMHFHPTPQSRDRMYVVFWKKGNNAPKLDMMPKAHCPKCAKDVDSVQTWKNAQKQYGKYNQQYVYCCPSCTSIVEPYYYAAMNVIDWSDIGERIGDRKKPLADKTVTRIEYGLDKFGGRPIQIHTSYSDQARGVVRRIDEPGFTDTTVKSKAIITNPFIINDRPSNIAGFQVKSVTEKLPTVLTDPALKVIVPFIVKLEHARTTNVSSVDDKFSTATGRQSQMLVSNIKSSLEALQTQTCTQGMGIVTTESWNSFLSCYNGGSNIASHITEAARTQPCGERTSLIVYEKPNIEDCYYRMLKAQEVKLSMAFDKDYKILGSQRNQVKQCGNAVTPPPMEFLVGRSIESLN